MDKASDHTENTMPAASRLIIADTLAPDSSFGATTPIYDCLRIEIMSLRMKPGSIINRQGLQRQFKLSSTPIRDALIRLGEEGLVEIVAQSSTRVSLIDIDKARQAQFLRRALEQEHARTQLARGMCRAHRGVAAADHDYVVRICHREFLQ